MRLSRIKKLCKNNRTIRLYKTADEMTGEVLQIISDGVNFFPLRGFPIMDEEMSLRVLDVPQDERTKWSVHDLEGTEYVLLRDLFANGGRDIPLKMTPLTVYYDKSYKALQTDMGSIVFADLEAINVVENGDNPPTWHIRLLEDDKHVVIAKRGMLGVEAVCACIWPPVECLASLKRITDQPKE